jgi:general stress protein YciG
MRCERCVSARQFALPLSDTDWVHILIGPASQSFYHAQQRRLHGVSIPHDTIIQEINMASDKDNQGSKNNQGGQSGTSNRGFASMDPAKQRAIAAEGGRAAHASGNAHEFSSEEAREAGRKGGQASHGGGSASASNKSSGSHSSSGGTRGGSSEQHSEAGRQSHKNER